jgi:hypothetical protein
MDLSDYTRIAVGQMQVPESKAILSMRCLME